MAFYCSRSFKASHSMKRWLTGVSCGAGDPVGSVALLCGESGMISLGKSEWPVAAGRPRQGEATLFGSLQPSDGMRDNIRALNPAHLFALVCSVCFAAAAAVVAAV